MVGAVVLSAGASYRMGSPKALLKIGNETFLQHVVGVLRAAGIRDIVIVLGSDAGVIRKSLSWFEGTVVVNEHWGQGQLSSIICGLDALPPDVLDGALISPVDQPLVTIPLLHDLLAAFENSKEKIIVPVFHGRRGHPTIFPRARFDELKSAPMEIGARHLLHGDSHGVVEVITGEGGAIINIDTPEEYRDIILHERPGEGEEGKR